MYSVRLPHIVWLVSRGTTVLHFWDLKIIRLAISALTLLRVMIMRLTTTLTHF